MLAGHGHRVIATARNVGDLSDLPAAERLALDVTDPAEAPCRTYSCGQPVRALADAQLSGPMMSRLTRIGLKW